MQMIELLCAVVVRYDITRANFMNGDETQPDFAMNQLRLAREIATIERNMDGLLIPA